MKNTNYGFSLFCGWFIIFDWFQKISSIEDEKSVDVNEVHGVAISLRTNFQGKYRRFQLFLLVIFLSDHSNKCHRRRLYVDRVDSNLVHNIFVPTRNVTLGRVKPWFSWKKIKKDDSLKNNSLSRWWRVTNGEFKLCLIWVMFGKLVLIKGVIVFHFSGFRKLTYVGQIFKIFQVFKFQNYQISLKVDWS